MIAKTKINEGLKNKLENKKTKDMEKVKRWKKKIVGASTSN